MPSCFRTVPSCFRYVTRRHNQGVERDRMSGWLYSPLVERAMRFAARAHAEQTRKGTDLPYLTHVCSCAMILLRAGFDDEELIAAALLHDVVEDTDVSSDQLARTFPPQVVEMVEWVTERKHDAQGRKRAWSVRKQEMIDRLRRAPLPVRALTLADKLHNLSSTLGDLESGADVWSRFNAPKERWLAHMRELVQCASGDDRSLRPLAQACRNCLDRLEQA